MAYPTPDQVPAAVGSWLTPSDYATVVVAFGLSFVLFSAGVALVIYTLKLKPR